MTKQETKLSQLQTKKYALEKQQLKLNEEIRYEEMLKIEKGLMPPYPFGFMCFQVDNWNEIKEKTVDRIERGQNWHPGGIDWKYFYGSDFLFSIDEKGKKSRGTTVFFSRQEAEEYAQEDAKRKKEEAEEERQRKIAEARKVLEQANALENDTK